VAPVTRREREEREGLIDPPHARSRSLPALAREKFGNLTLSHARSRIGAGARLSIAGSRPSRPERSREARIEQIRCALTTPRRTCATRPRRAFQTRRLPSGGGPNFSIQFRSRCERTSPSGAVSRPARFSTPPPGGPSRNLSAMGAVTDVGLMRRFFGLGGVDFKGARRW
jgi:hypothetical protein